MSPLAILGLTVLAYLVALALALFIWVRPNRAWLSGRSVALVFIAGGLSGFVAGFAVQPLVQSWLAPWLFHREYYDLWSGVITPQKLYSDQLAILVPNSRAAALVDQIVLAGLVEESLKFLVVFALVFWRKDFARPTQGFVYGVMAALGFGCTEAVYHIFDGLFLHPTNPGFDWHLPLLFWMHPALSCFWAVALGSAKSLPRKFGIPLVLLGFLVSVCVHGLVNFLNSWARENATRYQDPTRDWPLDWTFLLALFLLANLFVMTRMLRYRDTNRPATSDPAAEEYAWVQRETRDIQEPGL